MLPELLVGTIVVKPVILHVVQGSGCAMFGEETFYVSVVTAGIAVLAVEKYLK